MKTFKDLIFDGEATYKDFDDYVDELYTSFVLLKDPVISAAFPNLLKLTETTVQCYKKDEELVEIKVILDETK